MAPVSRRERIVLNDSGSWAPGSFRGDYDNNLLKGTVDGPTRQRVTSALCQKAYVRSINFARQQRPSQPESQANLVRADRNYGLEARAIPQGPPPPHLPGRPHPPRGCRPSYPRGVSVPSRGNARDYISRTYFSTDLFLSAELGVRGNAWGNMVDRLFQPLRFHDRALRCMPRRCAHRASALAVIFQPVHGRLAFPPPLLAPVVRNYPTIFSLDNSVGNGLGPFPPPQSGPPMRRRFGTVPSAGPHPRPLQHCRRKGS